jgi:hypothetical protein
VQNVELAKAAKTAVEVCLLIFADPVVELDGRVVLHDRQFELT